MSQSRLTVNVQASYAADFGKLLSFLKSLDPVAVVVCIDNMSAINRVKEIQQALPAAKIIGRYVFEQDGGMHLQPQAAGDMRKYIVSPLDAINAWQELGREGRMLYLLNEPQANGASQENIKRLSDWMLEAIKIASERGISLVLGNFGVGHPALLGNGEYDARFDDVLTALSKNRDTVALGMHVYQPADTFTRLDGMVKRCKMLGIKPPRVHITEAGFDAGSADDMLNGYKSRGFSGAQFAGFLIDKLKNVYSPYIADDVLQSIAVFCWGNEASWKNFNVENDIDWQSTVLDAATKGTLSMATKPLPPMYTVDPVTVGMKYKVNTPLDYIRLHTAPLVEATEVTKIYSGAIVTVVGETLAAQGQYWREVMTADGKRGFFSMQDGHVGMIYAPDVVITPAPEPAPPVIVTTPPATVETKYVIILTEDEYKLLQSILDRAVMNVSATVRAAA